MKNFRKSSVLFCSVLFCSVLFCSVLFMIISDLLSGEVKAQCNNTLWTTTIPRLGINTTAPDKPLTIWGTTNNYYSCIDPVLQFKVDAAASGVYNSYLGLLTSWNDYPVNSFYPSIAKYGDLIIVNDKNTTISDPNFKQNIVLATKNLNGSIKFATTPSGTTDQLRMIIRENGSVGIWNSNPLELLHIGDRMTFHIGAPSDFIGDNDWNDVGNARKSIISNSYASCIEFDHLNGRIQLGVYGWCTSAGQSLTYTEGSGGDGYKGITITPASYSGAPAGTCTAAIGIGSLSEYNTRMKIRGIGSDASTNSLAIGNTSGDYFWARDDGRVSIGNSAPDSRLVVEGTTHDATASAFKVWDNLVATLFHVRNDGNIGIGDLAQDNIKVRIHGIDNTNAKSSLHITDASQNSILFVRNDGNVGVGLSEFGTNTNINSRLVVRGYSSDYSSASLNVTKADNTSILFVRNDGNVGIGLSEFGTSTNLNSRLVVKGITSDNNASSLNILNSGNTSLFYVRNDGNVGIGFNTPGQKLAVNGKVRIGTNQINANSQYFTEYMLSVDGTVVASKVVVSVSDWADNVFDTSYKLKSIDDVNSYIKINNKLPDMPSETEVKNDGIDIAKMNAKLLQKIEELTLYVIELKKENTEIKDELKKLK